MGKLADGNALFTGHGREDVDFISFAIDGRVA